MATSTKDYPNKVDGIRGLKADKKFERFFYQCRVNGKRHSKIFDYSDSAWDKKTRVKRARAEAEAFRAEITGDRRFVSDTKLDDIAKAYFDVQPDTEWTRARRKQYDLYIKPDIGHKAVVKIVKHDVDSIRKAMERAPRGRTHQARNGCSARTIHKVLFQVLKPVLEYARDNGAIAQIPKIELPRKLQKERRRKKRVAHASEKLVKLYHAIMDRYKDDPFYRALFLFAVHGRRQNEILTLEWRDVDFDHNTYTIRAENNKIGEDQTYTLPHDIRAALLELRDDSGLVFKSPVTGKKLHSPRKQIQRLREEADIPELTMHYFRHIFVSALGETGASATIMSAALGHTDVETLTHYLTLDHEKGSAEATRQLENIIDVEADDAR